VRRGRGFTLVEVMIALVIFSMMMVATISALRAFGNTRLTVERLTGRVDEIRLLSGFLRQTMGAAMPVARYGRLAGPGEAGPGSGVYFSGRPDEMVWVAPIAAGAGFGGVYIFRLSLDQRQLVLRWHPYNPDASVVDWQTVERRVLLENVEDLRFGYRGSRASRLDGPLWQDNWVNTLGNPAVVRLSLKAGGRYWPEMVVRLDAGELNVR
jgi:general secretion pathway protein J